MNIKAIKDELTKLSNPSDATFLQRYFKTGKGEYGEGDIFIGIRIPVLRSLIKKYYSISLDENIELLQSPIHEERMFALLLLVAKYEKGTEPQKKNIFNCYLQNTSRINNWDLVDLSAPNIVGGYLYGKELKPLFKMANSQNLWDRRISIISTLYFIRKGEFNTTLDISEILLGDKHDLIHKAVGWMLREIGKRNIEAEIEFLNQFYKQMPRTMLRYSIEKFPEQLRQKFLRGEV